MLFALKPFDNPQLFSEFESLGVHGAPLQIAGQAGQNNIVAIVPLVIVHAVQGPLSRRHHVLVDELAALATVRASHLAHQ
jgi:hypothetical protein